MLKKENKIWYNILEICCVGTTFLIKILRKKTNNKGGNDMDEKIDILNELGEFTGKIATCKNVIVKDIGIEQFMLL